jgi:hypothetical protein
VELPRPDGSALILTTPAASHLWWALET